MKPFLLKEIKAISVIVGLVMFLFCIQLVYGFYIESKRTQEVSIIPLIANSWIYHGKKVKTRGFLKLGYENNHLHLDRESYEQKLSNYIWLVLNKEQMINYLSLDRGYVIVEGTFDVTLGRSAYPTMGGIAKVMRLQSINSD